jgi:hypothetical protein
MAAIAAVRWRRSQPSDGGDWSCGTVRHAPMGSPKRVVRHGTAMKPCTGWLEQKWPEPYVELRATMISVESLTQRRAYMCSPRSRLAPRDVRPRTDSDARPSFTAAFLFAGAAVASALLRIPKELAAEVLDTRPHVDTPLQSLQPCPDRRCRFVVE